MKENNLPDNYVENRSTKTYPTELGSQPFRPDDIELFKLDKTSNLKHHYVSKFEEIKSEYIKLMEEISINERVYKSKFSFQPIVGKTYYLYENDTCEFLSIISPEEWKFRYDLIGEFQLQTDGRWLQINC